MHYMIIDVKCMGNEELAQCKVAVKISVFVRFWKDLSKGHTWAGRQEKLCKKVLDNICCFYVRDHSRNPGKVQL